MTYIPCISWHQIRYKVTSDISRPFPCIKTHFDLWDKTKVKYYYYYCYSLPCYFSTHCRGNELNVSSALGPYNIYVDNICLSNDSFVIRRYANYWNSEILSWSDGMVRAKHKGNDYHIQRISTPSEVGFGGNYLSY